MTALDLHSDPGSWAHAIDRGCLAGRITEHPCGTSHVDRPGDAARPASDVNAAARGEGQPVKVGNGATHMEGVRQ